MSGESLPAEIVDLGTIEKLALAALMRAGTAERNARPVAASIAAAEAQGLPSHGLLRLPAYCDHVACGKVDGQATPTLSQPRPGTVIVDAKTGFAHPAIDIGRPIAIAAARACGVAFLAITNSYNCGVVGDHVERFAQEGFIALGFVNAPASIAPWGGAKPLFGTNPLAFAAPVAGGDPVVLDQSSSVVARGEIMLRAKSATPLEPGWALDAAGKPTLVAQAALKGSLMPAGGYKGSGQALMVELLAAALTGASFGFQASSFATNDGGPPRTGQSFVVIDPTTFGDSFATRAAEMIVTMRAQDGVRIPGARRGANRAASAAGVKVSAATLADLRKRAGV